MTRSDDTVVQLVEWLTCDPLGTCITDVKESRGRKQLNHSALSPEIWMLNRCELQSDLC